MRKKEKIYCVLLFLLLGSTIGLAKESYIKNRWNVHAGYSNSFHYSHEIQSGYKRLGSVYCNYGFSNFFDGGVSLGYSPSEVFIRGSKKYTHPINLMLYGLNVNYHILPHFIHSNDFRFDLYLSASMGRYSLKDQYMNSWLNGIDYGVYAGAAYYLTRHLGVYGEYGFGKNTQWRAGISYKFKRN